MTSFRLCVLFCAPCFIVGPTDAQALSDERAFERAALPARHSPESSVLVWGDQDGDGLADLYVIGTVGPDRLLGNRGDGQFEDRTELSGLAGNWGTTLALWEDVDGDRAADLLLLSESGALRLYRGSSTGTFFEVSDVSGLTPVPGAASARWIDYDLDGKTDLHLQTSGGAPVFFHASGELLFDRIELPLDGWLEVALPSPFVAPFVSSVGSEVVSGANGSGSLPVTGPPPPTPSAFVAGQPCTQGIADQANQGKCLSASSAPTVGMRYPLTDDFFLDGSGNLDIGGNVEVNGNLVLVESAGGATTEAAVSWLIEMRCRLMKLASCTRTWT